MKISRKASRDVAALSSSTLNPKFAGGKAPYYERVSHWYNELTEVLFDHGFTAEECPPIYYEEGRGRVYFTSWDDDLNGRWEVFFTWYTMPSGRVEIICYIP